MPRAGAFNPLVVPAAWFSPLALPEGWFDEVLLDVSAGGDVTAPVPTVTTVTAARMSRVVGKDSVDITWTADEAFIEYEIRIVPSGGSTQASGVQVETATVTSRTTHTVTITDDEIVAAQGGVVDGSKIMKIFVKDAADNWST